MRRPRPLGIRPTALLALCLASALPACGDDTAPAQPGELVRSSHERLAVSTDLTEARTLAVNDADFGLALMRTAQPTGDFFCSPHSISVALAMTYAGAAGATADEMRTTMRFHQEPAVLHQAFNTLDQALSSRGEGAMGVEGTPFRLRISNSLFADRTFTFRATYLDLIAEHYGAGVTVLDFARDPDGSRVAINLWVAHQTEDRIPELLPMGSIDPSTVLVLTNAVYFNAAWDDAFAEASTRDGAFHLADGTTATVPLMRGEVGTTFASGTGWRAAEIPFEGADVSMLLIVPDDLAAFEVGLDGARYAEIAAALHADDVMVTMPRFEMRTELSLRDALSDMGMAGAFQSADLSAMTPEMGLFISDVVHEAWIRVNEKGAEAAAATAVIVGRVSVPDEVVADRPFLFVVRDRATGAVVFLGRVTDPR